MVRVWLGDSGLFNKCGGERPPGYSCAQPDDCAVTSSADMRTVAHAGAVTAAVYVALWPGASTQGSMLLAWMAWHWLNTYG